MSTIINSFPFEDGDRVCFIGDSITHANIFMSYIYEYYLTRFPDKKITLFNCGIAGDRSLLAAGRLEYDVLVNKPTKAVVMFGMNDIGRHLYTGETSDPKILEERELALQTFRSGMERIVKTLQMNNVHVILVAATPYDQTVQLECPNNFGSNDALARCARIVKELADQYSCNYVDLYSPMNEINMAVQKCNPGNTIISADRIHPCDEGHLLMAYFFLKQQGVLSRVASSQIFSRKGSVSYQYNCEISHIVTEGSNLSFDYKPKAFPLYRDKNHEAAEKLAPIVEEMNSEIISITGMPEGTYKLMIDDVEMGVYTNSSLESGVNTAILPNSPMEKNAEIIHQANRLRDKWEQKLRTIRFVEYSPRNNGAELEDFEAVKELLESDLEKIINEPYYDYFRVQTNLYYKMKNQEADILRQIDNSQKDLNTKNKLVTYRVSIHPVS